MAERLQVFKCDVCGHIVEVLHEGQGELVCCNQPMKLLVEGSVDADRKMCLLLKRPQMASK